jgi:hypothetical protein
MSFNGVRLVGIQVRRPSHLLPRNVGNRLVCEIIVQRAYCLTSQNELLSKPNDGDSWGFKRGGLHHSDFWHEIKVLLHLTSYVVQSLLKLYSGSVTAEIWFL